jgi:transcriptional regulator with XRE-family HTH domain
MDAEGLRVSDVARITGLSRQYVSQVVNRVKPYGRAPAPEKLQALAKIPGLSLDDIAKAVAESTGQPLPSADALTATEMTPLRRHVHTVVDKIPEQRLDHLLQVLLTYVN